MTERFLDKTYGCMTPEATQAHYDDWSASYDAEISENGYATPTRCAEALARHMPDRSMPVLDFACGTGLSGLALKVQGFSQIDGVDVSPGMLDGAQERGLYRQLIKIDAGAEMPGTAGDYAAIAAIGALGVGAAPASTMAQMADALNPGGLLVFSLNDHGLADADFIAGRDALLNGAMRELEQSYGDHLPGIDLKSSVYVFEKL